jgi:DNA-binding HxlR family transcriptional regulator
MSMVGEHDPRRARDLDAGDAEELEPLAAAAPAPEPRRRGRRVTVTTLERPFGEGPVECCPRLHETVELVGKRWSGAIIYVLLQGGRMRFSEIGHAVPDLSDRLLSERLKELEARGIVDRLVHDDAPVRVEYELTERGRDLRDGLLELKAWGDRWLL